MIPSKIICEWRKNNRVSGVQNKQLSQSSIVSAKIISFTLQAPIPFLSNEQICELRIVMFL